MTRQDANLQILQLIKNHIMITPDLRFGQILVNIGITNEIKVFDEWDDILETEPIIYNNIGYYEESEVTLKRILGE